MIARLSSSEGLPGDLIVLTTDDGGNPNLYASLAANGPQPVYLVGTSDFAKEIARYGGQRCGAPEQRYLGNLTWEGGTGSLSFRVPNVPKGDYFFELTVPHSSPSCWRIGAPSGPLVLTVHEALAPAPSLQAANAETRPWARPLIAVAALVLVAGGIVTVGLWRGIRH